MSLAEKLIEQGIEKGKLEIAEQMLNEGSELVLIVKVTGLSTD